MNYLSTFSIIVVVSLPVLAALAAWHLSGRREAARQDILFETCEMQQAALANAYKRIDDLFSRIALPVDRAAADVANQYADQAPRAVIKEPVYPNGNGWNPDELLDLPSQEEADNLI